MRVGSLEEIKKEEEKVLDFLFHSSSSLPSTRFCVRRVGGEGGEGEIEGKKKMKKDREIR